MLYFDTSFLAPLFKPELHSLQVERFVAGLAVGRTSLSHWTRVEFASLLAKNVRMGLMATTQAIAAGEAFDLFVTRGCTILDVGRRDFDRARHYLSDHQGGLRAGDALHLAIASNAAVDGVYSFDKTMIAVGASLGLPMNMGFPVPAA